MRENEKRARKQKLNVLARFKIKANNFALIFAKKSSINLIIKISFKIG